MRGSGAMNTGLFHAEEVQEEVDAGAGLRDFREEVFGVSAEICFHERASRQAVLLLLKAMRPCLSQNCTVVFFSTFFCEIFFFPCFSQLIHFMKIFLFLEKSRFDSFYYLKYFLSCLQR